MQHKELRKKLSEAKAFEGAHSCRASGFPDVPNDPIADAHEFAVA
jgi:hypothetical protein